MFELWAILVILIVCPLLGGLPLIEWITYTLKRKRLSQLGTGNISVSAAFYHGGTLVGILAVLSEAFKGIAAVLLCRAFFPEGSFWEIVALIALVIGRYWIGRGAGTTNVVWGFVVHDPLVAIFVFFFAGISFSVMHSRHVVKFGVLLLFPLFVTLLHLSDVPKMLAAVVLACLMAWIYTKIPDDMNLPAEEAQTESQAMLEFLRGDRAMVSLDEELDAAIVGEKAATLSQIKRWGYSVPKGWVLAPIDEDPELLTEFLQPSELSPLVVRSSAIGEDSELASAAGQYKTVLNVTSPQELQQAIAEVKASYNHPSAVQYRRDRGLNETAMAVLIQQQVQSVFSGVAFSRDPITQQGDAIIIEALPGSPTQVVSGKVTPEQYRAFVFESENSSSVQLEGEGRVPQALIKQVAYLAYRLEKRYNGTPQDIEWSYDGQTLWVLQSRPITTLLPIWTQKIAAEVIPGVIHPLTWSINRPLTCGVWGELFTLVLGERASGLDFTETATLHYSRAYFNASLLGDIFIRMGLPPESLEFLTRGAKLSKPSWKSTWENLPGLGRLLKQELSLEKDFKQDYYKLFIPGLSQLAQEDINQFEAPQLLVRIDLILELLRRGTYYSILAPLSAALRQSIFRVKDKQIDRSVTPEVAALRSLTAIAADAKEILSTCEPQQVFDELNQTPKGKKILQEFDELLQDYGYLSEVGTDISVPTWRENPQLIEQMFVQLIQGNELQAGGKNTNNNIFFRTRKRGFVQRRVDIKGRVTEVYSRLLAELRWSFVALEKIWLKSGLLKKTDDIFFLDFDEVRRLVAGEDSALVEHLVELVEFRRSQFAQDSEITQVPFVVYGNTPPHPLAPSALYSDQILQGIGASHGQVEGRVKVLRNLQEVPEINRDTILVVPYTDSGWAPLLLRAGGLIAEAGGRLSHGAIVAREYGIPAIMDVRGATWLLQDGQRVRIDGSRGIVELSNDLRPE
ncbi:pyruvate phosphate dikinase PEP/pyruvate-binding protein [Nostoc linckia z18]|uniref:Pyruvate phosphate dikinase PEP/pyruvate-binding protein n=2 Tax=Nostoc linckia TaxID=92942 RepID=A0A9Q6EJV6_NOSLI|nr:glycerol-3-phosphate acyltransferase [Nostoc linckia]PHK40921.1 pyruvate phosphate dikinase PEP/pyruvate-binding protein [Nostoc linckia z15]PHK46465.1 pyruvate phosphate dikinase PEP/pyruvate-binding protein [Nostoc linckia z16]PHJ60265.1 pyruvate phosphate dikinase PEP/pyruvate-binding protein [Nostoc linckia z1]PHJ63831.1 pyruvate phosphate dikinase PEP/pyruvate-binding protein [Nostoc linckia z3]PHJ70845.1 pyruvate phosphate dikinase PEP/pyruvate-binding protein [Nostoc linckia z2]